MTAWQSIVAKTVVCVCVVVILFRYSASMHSPRKKARLAHQVHTSAPHCRCIALQPYS